MPAPLGQTAELGLGTSGVESHICSKGAHTLPILPTAVGQVDSSLIDLPAATLPCQPYLGEVWLPQYNPVFPWQLNLVPVCPLATSLRESMRQCCSTPSSHWAAVALQQAALRCRRSASWACSRITSPSSRHSSSNCSFSHF